jgi:hypothetical protein
MVAFLIAFLAFAARLIPTPRTIDDAYITFRYARNILEGLGFVYNAGERVLGTTTPLYTLLMAALAGLTGWREFPWLALIVNALADSVTCLLLIRIGEKISGQRAVGIAAALLWAIAPMSVAFAIGGMETSVFILLLALTADFYLHRRTRAAAVTAGLLLLTRPDGILLVAPLILDLSLRHWRTTAKTGRSFFQRLPVAEAGLFLLVTLPWAIFAWAYFGSPVPNSVAAKSVAYQLSEGSALIRLLQHYSTPFFENDVLGAWWQLAGVFVYLFLCLIATLAAFRRDARIWPLALYPWLYFAAFSIGNPLIFRWYLAPPLPFYYIFILTGLWQILEQVLRAITRHVPPSKAGWFQPTYYFILPISFFFITLLSDWTLKPDHGPQQPAPNTAWHALELVYERVGRAMAGRITPQTTVIAAGDIGALGYYSNARILDTVGLVSPQTSAYYPLEGQYVAGMAYAVAPRLITEQKPDYTVFLEIYGRKSLYTDTNFLADYALFETIPTDIYASAGMLIHQRRP